MCCALPENQYTCRAQLPLSFSQFYSSMQKQTTKCNRMRLPSSASYSPTWPTNRNTLVPTHPCDDSGPSGVLSQAAGRPQRRVSLSLRTLERGANRQRLHTPGNSLQSFLPVMFEIKNRDTHLYHLPLSSAVRDLEAQILIPVNFHSPDNKARENLVEWDTF